MPCLHTHTLKRGRKEESTQTHRHTVQVFGCVRECRSICVYHSMCVCVSVFCVFVVASLGCCLLRCLCCCNLLTSNFFLFFYFFYNIFSPYFLAFCSFIVVVVVVVDAVSGVAWLIKLCAQVHFRVCEPTTFYYFVSCFLLYSSIRFVSRVVVASRSCCCYFIAILHLTFAAFRCMQRTHIHMDRQAYKRTLTPLCVCERHTHSHTFSLINMCASLGQFTVSRIQNKHSITISFSICNVQH